MIQRGYDLFIIHILTFCKHCETRYWVVNQVGQEMYKSLHY